MKTLAINHSSKQNLVAKLKAKGEILRFEEDPILCSLATCLALDFEVGHAEFDRLSPYLGVTDFSLWEKQIFVENGEIGISLSRKDGLPLQPHHSDLRWLLDESSVDENGQLSRAVIFPRKVAATYAQKGFELVIVRDWILNSALSLDDNTVGYLYCNEWEIRTRIAAQQAKMMVNHQLAFFGTHDIVDHLFGLDKERFDHLGATYRQAMEHFSRTQNQSRSSLLTSYLIGVALDDMAQPRWYGSPAHEFVVRRCLELLERLPTEGPAENLQIPDTFHHMASAMRETQNFERLDKELSRFQATLSF